MATTAFEKPSIEQARTVIRSLRAHYRSGSATIGDDFFVPCLQHCSTYKRAAGYFSSSALVTWSKVVPILPSKENLKLQLLISPILSKEDQAVLKRTTDPFEQHKLRQEVADRIAIDAFNFATNPGDVELRLKLLAWLITTNKLELRFAFPEHVESPGIYHEKFGLFEFPWGDTIAFTGSANETFHGYVGNYESIDVFRNWLSEDRDRVDTKQLQFIEAWEGKAAGLLVLPLSERAMQYVRTKAPESPSLLVPREHSATLGPERQWRHQDEAIATFLARQRGILEMATGTGKTRTALRIAEHLLSEKKIATIVVSADGTDLLDQWYRELLHLARRVPRPLTVLRHYAGNHERDRFILNPSNAVLLASRPNLPPALRRLRTAGLAEGTLLIHDEVHRLGSPGNRQALQGLSDGIKFRLGLSATPEREYDSDGTSFVLEHIGPVLFRFPLEDAIRRNVLCPFNYYPLKYDLTSEDRDKLQAVHKKKAARAAAGQPMSDEEVWIELSRVYKTSRAKLPLFKELIEHQPQLLQRCIIFVETSEYGEEVLELVHRHRADFHTYYASEDSEVLQRFAIGELECLLTCHRLSEGIDIRNLQTVVLFSASRARLETIQRIGRCLRVDPLNPIKKANIIDFIRAPEPSSIDVTADEEREAWLSRLASIQPEEKFS